ncbi:TPA: hypothetical protein ACS72N_001518 [Providencia alcalifaciens]
MILFFYVLFFIATIIFVCIKRKRFLLNSRRLQSQWLFILAVSYPIISSFYFMIWIGCSYTFRLDAVGFNAFLEINKFSLGILALSPILGVFVVYAHRSLQSEMQLDEAQKKNKVDMYYSKRKFIQEQLDNVDKGFGYGLKNTNEIYNLAFIIGDNYQDDINVKFYHHIDNKIASILYNLKKIIESNDYAKEKLTADERFKITIMDSINSIAAATTKIQMILINNAEYTNKFNNICSEFLTSYSYYEFTNQDEHDTLTFVRNNLLIIRSIYIALSVVHKLVHRVSLCLISNSDIKQYMVNLVELEKAISNYLYADELGNDES